MSKTNAPVVPDTHVLMGLMKEYEEMLRGAADGVKKALAASPEEERFWDALTDLHPLVTMVEARSSSIADEIEELIDQLPDD